MQEPFRKRWAIFIFLALVILGLRAPVSTGAEQPQQDLPLTLEEALKLALEKNKDIHVLKRFSL